MIKYKTQFCILILFILCCVLNYTHYNLFVLKHIGIYNLITSVNANLFEEKSHASLKLESECKCRSSETIFLEKNIKIYSIKQNDKILYNLTQNEFEKSLFTCDLYKSLRRGKNQKVISYSLYGKNPLYYNYLKNLTYDIKSKYKNWIMRIYYDNTINKSVICEIDCLKDKNGNLLDNVDFCNIENLPIKNSFHNDWSLAYLHAMMWRWLPIGDSFVDVFSSRDTDSHIIQREIDSVNVWLKSNKVAHLMRDNLGHGTEILGGMWGFYSARDRFLAYHLLNLIINSKNFNLERKSEKGYDQFFLTSVYSLIKKNSITHDSYTCKQYGGSPFPTRRVGNCFVGKIGECNTSALFDVCPIKCRPKNHLDWQTC